MKQYLYTELEIVEYGTSNWVKKLELVTYHFQQDMEKHVRNMVV